MITETPPDMSGHIFLALGVSLLLVEFFVPSFGLIGISGIAIFLYGAHQVLDAQALMIAWGLAGVALLGMIAAGVILYRAKNKGPISGSEGMLGQPAIVIEWGENGRGLVQLQGELWQATSSHVSHHTKGETVIISGFDDMVLKVRPANEAI